MNSLQRSNVRGQLRSTDSRHRSLILRLAILGFPSWCVLGACGGSGEAGTTGPPPPGPPPPQPSFVCAESSAGASEGVWQLQRSGVEGLMGGIQFLDASTGRALRNSRDPGGSGLPSSDFPPLLLTTSDGGSTWCRIRIPEDPKRDPRSLSFIDPDIGFVGMGQGCTVMRTEDGGLTWTTRRLCEVAPFTPFLSITPIDSDRLWASGEQVLFRSDDRGISWEEVAVPEMEAEASGFAFFTPEVGVFTDNAAGDIFRTTDGGLTWDRQPNPGDRPFLFDIARVNGTTAVAVGGLAAREVEIVRTTDAGETWEIIRPGVNATLWAVDFGSDGFGVAVGDRGTILVSTDGGVSWGLEESPVDAQLLSVSVLDAEHAWVSGKEGVILVRRPE